MMKQIFRCAMMCFILAVCFMPQAFASQELVNRYLPRLQGNWYNADGKVALNFVGATLNGCKLVDIVNAAGGNSDVGLTIRVLEAGGYRDIYLSCTNLTTNPEEYHQYIAYNDGGFPSPSRTTVRRHPRPVFFESVGGIGLGMFSKEVAALYGTPAKSSTTSYGRMFWEYPALGLKVTFESDIVCAITIYKGGNRRFDWTGMNCNDSLYNYKEKYGMRHEPVINGFNAIGHNEYMSFAPYIRSITLTTFWN